MKIKWLNPESEFDKVVLAGDVGGTNTNLALVGEKSGNYTIILEIIFPSAEITELLTPLKKILEIALEKRNDLKPAICCISAAGVVENNRCDLTNCNWSIDGNAIERELGIKTFIINDFLAISHGILILDVNDPEQITPLEHPDGSLPEKKEGVIAVMGPGTGLGVSFLVPHKGEYVAASSEGGHIAFAPIDEESTAFCNYMREKIGMVPGVELFVSGQGVKNIFHFYKDVKKVPMEGLLSEINATADKDKPGKISRGAAENEVCHSMMNLFVRMFASTASNLACLTLPFGGLYLAGGTVPKDLRWLQENHLFMNIFEKNYNSFIVPLLKKVPVYVIRDYSISLYGAASAGMKKLTEKIWMFNVCF